MQKKTLYIGNLPYTASPESLKVLLEPFCPCDIFMIPGRKFAYIEVEAQNAAAAGRPSTRP